MTKAKLFSIVLCLLTAFFIFSCSSHSESSSLTSSLDITDNLISQGYFDLAFKSLKKLEKKAFSSYDHLALSRRYIVIGETKAAEKILKRGLKRLPDNPELSAVYSVFLLKESRLEEAFKISLCLKESRYSSIYAECVMRKALSALSEGRPVIEDAFNSVPKKKRKIELEEPKSDDEIKEIFCNQAFIPIYESAFLGSGEGKWILNAASLLMRNGDYKQAASIYPKEIKSLEESLFWGCVFFDSGLYAESIQALDASNRLATLGNQHDILLKNEIMMLESDGLYIEDEDEKSEEIRKNLIGSSEKVSPLVYMNSAMFEKRNGNTETEYERLCFLSEEYPDYLPGLSALGVFSIEQSSLPPEDELTLHLRSTGLKTLEMEKRDKIPTVSLDEVIDKISSLSENEVSPSLLVLMNTLEDEKKRIDREQKSTASIWGLLEKNYSDGGVYPSEIVEHCVLFLLDEGLFSDAESLFENYIGSKYDFKPTENPGELELWECEVSAWFACQKGDFASAIVLYEFIAENYGDRLQALNSYANNSAVVNSFVNLGVLYASIGRVSDAMAILNRASAKSIEPTKKAEILFRLAELIWSEGDSQGASRTLHYALSLNPEHNRARLLQKKIQAGM